MRRIDRDLIKTARRGHAPRLRKLLEQGAGVNARGKYGCSALLLAASGGQTDAVRVLLDGGADPLVCASDNASPLFFAVARGHEETVRLLLARGADPDAARDCEYPASGDSKGVAPVHVAISNGHQQIAQLLVEAGAHLTHIYHGIDVLAAARKHGLRDLVRYLVQRQA